MFEPRCGCGQDALYNLYDRVQVGGYVIVDDFGWTERLSFGARDAIMDFRTLHGIEDDSHAIRNIDLGGAWFYKAREVDLRRELYLASLSSDAKEGRQRLLRPPGTVHFGPSFVRLMTRWRKQWTAAEEAAHVRAEALDKQSLPGARSALPARSQAQGAQVAGERERGERWDDEPKR